LNHWLAKYQVPNGNRFGNILLLFKILSKLPTATFAGECACWSLLFRINARHRPLLPPFWDLVSPFLMGCFSFFSPPPVPPGRSPPGSVRIHPLPPVSSGGRLWRGQPLQTLAGRSRLTAPPSFLFSRMSPRRLVPLRFLRERRKR